MKRLVKHMVLCALMTMSVSTVCLAEDAEAASDAPQVTTTADATASNPVVSEWLSPAAGEWYNTKGDLVMTIEERRLMGQPLRTLKTIQTAIRVKARLRFMNKPATDP